MPRMASLNWDGFTGGEDSARSCTDPLSVPNGWSSIMDNIEPEAGRLRPRHGSRLITQPKNIWWLGEYQKANGGYGIMVDNGDLKSISYASGSQQTLIAGWLNERRQISSVRVGKYLILLVDLDGMSVVIYEKAGSLVSFSAYISNEITVLTDFYLDLASNLASIANQSGGFDISAPRNLTYTWVLLEDAATKTFDLTTGMPGAQLESWENAANRIQLRYAKMANPDGTPMTGVMGELFVKADATEAPASATHLRLYMTMAAPVTTTGYDIAQTIADGLVYRWVADIPVSLLSSPIKIPGNDGDLAGSVNLCWSTGRDDLPAGGSIKFFDGRLFVYGGKMESNPGRSYFSAVVDGSTEQLSRLLSFRYSTDFIDTSTDDSEPGIGMGISHGSLIFFNSRSVYSLSGVDYPPQAIDVTRGAVGGITEIGQRVFYLSQSGPAVVSGTTVDDVSNFKSDMVRPGIANFSAFFDPSAVIKGMWHNDSWMLTDGANVACYLMRNGAEGTWRFTPGEPMSFKFSCSPKKGELWVGGDDKPIFSIMDRSRFMDNMTPFLCRLVTNATYIPAGMVSGEALQVWTNTRWSDNSQLLIALLGDFGRLADVYQFTPVTDPGAAAGVVPGQRGEVLQIVRQGAMSHWFQIEIQKYAWNRDILFGKIRLDILPRNWHPEGVSISDPGRAEPILDAGFLEWDPQTTEL